MTVATQVTVHTRGERTPSGVAPIRFGAYFQPNTDCLVLEMYFGDTGLAKNHRQAIFCDSDPKTRRLLREQFQAMADDPLLNTPESHGVDPDYEATQDDQGDCEDRR